MFYLDTMGEKSFWHSKNRLGHSNSRLWHGLTQLAIARPHYSLGDFGIIAIPFLLNVHQTLNFKHADELPETHSTQVGVRLILELYYKGMATPNTIVITRQQALNTTTTLGTIDDLTQDCTKEKGVQTVATVTQPGGRLIKSLYSNELLKTNSAGLKTSVKGLKTVQAGRLDAHTTIQNAHVAGSTTQVLTLDNGTNTLSSGASSRLSGISQYTTGVTSSNSGLGTLNDTMPAHCTGVHTLSTGSTTSE